jgi:hypothetical protein
MSIEVVATGTECDNCLQARKVRKRKDKRANRLRGVVRMWKRARAKKC